MLRKPRQKPIRPRPKPMQRPSPLKRLWPKLTYRPGPPNRAERTQTKKQPTAKKTRQKLTRPKPDPIRGPGATIRPTPKLTQRLQPPNKPRKRKKRLKTQSPKKGLKRQRPKRTKREPKRPKETAKADEIRGQIVCCSYSTISRVISG